MLLCATPSCTYKEQCAAYDSMSRSYHKPSLPGEVAELAERICREELGIDMSLAKCIEYIVRQYAKLRGYTSR